jgi:hypothetical protein
MSRVAKELINARELAQIKFQQILKSIVLEKHYKPLNVQKAVVQVLVLLEIEKILYEYDFQLERIISLYLVLKASMIFNTKVILSLSVFNTKMSDNCFTLLETLCCCSHRHCLQDCLTLF